MGQEANNKLKEVWPVAMITSINQGVCLSEEDMDKYHLYRQDLYIREVQLNRLLSKEYSHQVNPRLYHAFPFFST